MLLGDLRHRTDVVADPGLASGASEHVALIHDR
jgi:hypothetical protein